jgi:hypothetical protein
MVGVGKRGFRVQNSIHPKADKKTFAERKCDAVSTSTKKKGW